MSLDGQRGLTEPSLSRQAHQPERFVVSGSYVPVTFREWRASQLHVLEARLRLNDSVRALTKAIHGG